jgi:hypothetical protein
MVESVLLITERRVAWSVSIRRRPQGACLQNIPVLGLGLHGVQDTVGSERFDRLDEG